MAVCAAAAVPCISAGKPPAALAAAVAARLSSRRRLTSLAKFRLLCTHSSNTTVTDGVLRSRELSSSSSTACKMLRRVVLLDSRLYGVMEPISASSRSAQYWDWHATSWITHVSSITFFSAIFFSLSLFPSPPFQVPTTIILKEACGLWFGVSSSSGSRLWYNCGTCAVKKVLVIKYSKVSAKQLASF